MADSAIIVTWGRNISGREQMGMGIFMSALEHYNKVKASGGLTDVRVYLCQEGNLGQFAGMITLEGSDQQVRAVLASDAHHDLLIKAGHVVADLNVVQAFSGAAVPQRIEQVQKIRKQLGI